MTQEPTTGTGEVAEEQRPAGPAEQPEVSGAGAPGEPAAPAPGAPDGGPGAGAAPDDAAGAWNEDQATAQAGASVEADMADAERMVAALTADLQRLHAEYVNYKKRVDRDRELVLQNATFAVLSALMPVLDDVDRARAHGELEGGFKAVAESLERVVAGQGLTKFGEPGDEFDPRLHEALMHGHSPDVKTTTCQEIVSAGYRIGDRVVRPARVTVVDPEPAGDSGAAEEGAAAER